MAQEAAGQQSLFPEEFDDASQTGGEEVPSDVVAPSPGTDQVPPRIRTVRLRNFKRFNDFTLTLGPFNVLAGPNNTGKSTVLQAIDLFYSLVKALRDGESFTAKSRFIPATMLPVAEGRDVFYGQIQRQGNVPVEAIVHVTFVNGDEIAVGLRQLFGASNCRVLEAKVALDTLSALRHRPALYVPSSIGIVRDEEYRTPARRAGLISAGRNNEVLRNVLLELRQNRPERFERLQTILIQRFTANVRDVAFEELTDQFLHAAYASESGLRHDLYSAGAGFIQVLHLLAFALSRDASIILLDEPDAHLHSNVQRVVVELLEDLARSDGLQVVLSTHSKEIINFVDPSRLVLLELGATQAAPAVDSVATIAALRSVGVVDNVDAFELLKNRRCLFIEGKAEATILSRFASTLKLSVFTGDGRVVAIPVGGSTKFEHVEQLKVIEDFLGQTIGSLELRDRDGLLDGMRTAIMRDSKRPLRIWDRDCIESYLMNGVVVARVAAEVAKEHLTEIDLLPERVETVLMDLCQELRDETTDRVSAKLIEETWQREKERVPVQEANQAARDAVGKDWETLEGRLKWVSGKKLLARVREKIKEEFGVSFSNERLAEAFQPDEIATEVRDAINEVDRIERQRTAAARRSKT